MLSLLLLAASFGVNSASADLRDWADKALPTYIECNLRTEATDCEAVRSGFFTNYGRYFERVSRVEEAKIHLTLTDQEIPGAPTQFTFAWSAHDSLEVSDFKYVTKIDTSVLDDLAVLNELVASSGKGASIYLKVIKGEIDANGQLVVTSGLPSTQKPTSKFNEGPFYINIYLNTMGSRSGSNRSLNGFGGTSLNYSSDKVRLILGGDVSRQSATVPSDGGTISATNKTLSLYGIGAYSVRKKWSVAVIGFYSHDEGKNVNAEKELATGLEWTLVPYRTTETREVYARIGGGVRDLDLFSENDLGYQRQQYAMIFAQMFANWTFFENKAKFSLNGSVTMYPNQPGYQSYRGASSLFYQISPAIQLTGSFGLSYQKKSLTYPKNPDYSNPLQSLYLSGSPGASTNYSIGVNVTFGNALRKSRDRRWSSF